MKFNLYSLKRSYNIFILLLLSLASVAQNFSVSGKVSEEGGDPAIGAAIFILDAKDSSLVKGAATNETGDFKITDLSSRTYIMKVTYLGFSDYFKTLALDKDIDLPPITLKSSAKKLAEVKVETQAVMATQSGDTTSYNSKAFKVNKDANAEDLVTKMPGVTTTDGKIQAQGEDVKQVLIDGKPFFGDDPNAVLKNIPAEIIDKVQVFDKKSDQSAFTGFDDGNTSKTINIVTKLEFRNGIFGKVYGGGGYQDVYRAGGVFNRFKEKQRLSVLVMSNNVNEQNFSSEDLLGVTSGSGNNNRGNFGGRGGGGNRPRGQGGGGQSGSADNFLVNIQNGITTTHAAGLNYSDSWGKKTTVSGSYFFNATQNKAVTNLLRQYILGSTNGLKYNENNIGNSDNYNHRLNARIECKLDSFNSLIIQPKVSVQMNNGKSTLFGENKYSDITASNTSNTFKSNLSASNLALPVQFRHAFRKRGRTLSFDVNPSYNFSGGNNSLEVYNNFYSDSVYTDSVNQRSVLDKTGFSGTGSVVYTEPLGKRGFLSVNYNGSYTYTDSKKNTYDRNAATGDFSLTDTLLSNVFNNQYQSHAGGLSYRYQKEKMNFSIGSSYQYADLYKQQKFPGQYTLNKNFESVLPNASFQYRYSTKKNLRINYRTNTNAPSVDQLQDVLNNSNTLQLSIGNPSLKQTYQHNLNLRYSAVNTEKSTSLFFLISGTYADDYISNSTIIAERDTVVYNDIFLARGSQITRPDNVNNYYNLRSFLNYSFPIKKLKSNINLNIGGSYNNIPAIINNKINYSNTSNLGFGVVISSNISEKIDFMLSSTPSYNYVSNTLQTSSNSTYYNQNSRAKVTITPVKWLVFQAEYTNTYYNGLSGGYNQNISLLNGAVAVKFFKDQSGELRFFVFDILKQNNSIQRNTTQTYIEDTQTNILQRYYMLTFTYNFKKYFKKETDKQTK